MPTEETRRTIDAMTRDDIVGEIARGTRSRFQGESAAYLHQRMAQLDAAAAAQREAREQGNFDTSNQVAARANDIAIDANRLSSESNAIAKQAVETAKQSYRASIVAVIVAVVSAIIAVISLNAGKP